MPVYRTHGQSCHCASALATVKNMGKHITKLIKIWYNHNKKQTETACNADGIICQNDIIRFYFQRVMDMKHYALADILLTLLGGCTFRLPMYASVHFLPSCDVSHQDHMYSHHRTREAWIPPNDTIQHFVQKLINYSYFRVNEPNVIDDTDRKIFLLERHNLEQWQERHSDILTGVLEVIPNGTVHGDIDCGWRTNSSVFTSRPQHVRNHYPVLCPLLVSQSEYFQHFIDGVLPKLIQLRPIIHFNGVEFLFRRPRDLNIYEILEHVNLSGDNVAFYDGDHITSDYLINTCITPPLHLS